MSNKPIKVNPAQAAGATRSEETQGATNSSQDYMPTSSREMRKNLHNSLIIISDCATLFLELGGLGICGKGLWNLFSKKKKNE